MVTNMMTNISKGYQNGEESSKYENPESLKISRGMIMTTLGAIGYLICDGSKCYHSPKNPILCFHSSPRSSDEYLEVLPMIAGTGRVAVALDAPGYGISDNPPYSISIDDIADAFLEVASSLLLKSDEPLSSLRFIAVGNLMGCFVGVSLASRYPENIVACIHSNLYFFPEPTKKDTITSHHSESKGEEKIPDSFELHSDGSHLVSLNNKRSWLDEELNFRVVHSEMAYLIKRRARYARGISIEDLSQYDFASAAKKSSCPALCVGGEASMALFDQIGYNGTKQFNLGVELLADNAEVVLMTGKSSTINMINQSPSEFVDICAAFMDRHNV